MIHKILNTVTVHCIGATKDAYFFDGNITWDDNNGDFGSIDLQEVPYGSSTIIGMVAKQEVQNVIWGGKKNLLFTVMSMVEHAFAQFKKGAETC